ncbi:hypothetical protein H8356DRAFT_1429046 [Neocallimastix lanati (nom. inval.)]|nr:hypothetical protein H8356DRAFT_1429046 [Neocallimastix sp. JGI-2020a]
MSIMTLLFPIDKLFGVWIGIDDITNRKTNTYLSNYNLEDIILLIFFRLIELYDYGAKFLIAQCFNCNKFLIKYVNGFHNEYYDVNLLADDTYFELIYEEENYEKLGIYNITYRFN